MLLASCGNNTSATSSDGLQVVASTTIVGDVVARVGGNLINLTVLFPSGTDPHTFEPRPQDIAAISDADVVVIHGLDLEETLESTLASNVNGILVHAADGVEVLAFAKDEHEDEDHEAEDEHEHEGGDPHTWTNPNNVMVWTQNIASALSEADSANATTYQANAEAYIDELRELDTWIRAKVKIVPAENRELVTDHATFRYFADEYGFEQVGLVVAASSTNAAPSAKELAELIDAIQEHNVPAIFVGTTVNPALAEQVAEDTGAQVVFLYTGSLSESGGEADSYLAFMKYNVDAIVEALK
jgi:ABC-type Zn uptake system ZnuABC Zn-binding protein ZnuA